MDYMDENLLTPSDVKKLLRCSRSLVYKLAARGQIPCIRWECPGEGTTRPCTMVRFRAEDVAAFLDANYVGKRRGNNVH